MSIRKTGAGGQAAGLTSSEKEKVEINSFLESVHLLLQKLNPTNLTPIQEETYDWYRSVHKAVNTPHAKFSRIVSEKIVPFLIQRLKLQKNGVSENFDKWIPEYLPSKTFPEFEEVITRRKICQFLEQLDKITAKSGFHDEMTISIKKWAEFFFRGLSLTNSGADTIFKRHIELLNHLLVDPFDPLNRPLDENAVLGSDQKTYGKMSLILFLANQPKELHHKFPFDPENKISFVTERHVVVQYIFKWLKEHKIVLPGTQKLKEQYQALLNTKKVLPRIPTKNTEELRLEKERIQELEMKKQSEIEKLQKNIGQGEGARKAKEVIDPLIKQAQEIHQQHLARMKELEEKRESALQEIRNEGNAHRELADQQEQKIAELEEDIQELKEESNQNKQDITQLEEEVKEFADETKERNKRWQKQLMISAALAVGSWGASTLLPNAMAVLPVDNGLKLMGGMPLY